MKDGEPGGRGNGGLAPKDSNLDKQIQSLSCYRYTRGQFRLRER